METQSIEHELLGLEQQFWQAVKDNDVDTAGRLTDDQCIIAGAQGATSVDRAGLRAMLKKPSYTLDHFELTDPKVYRLNDVTAVIAYRVHEELRVDGKPVKLDATDASTWVRRDGEWRCALHTEALAGDPFGRDRARPRARKPKAAPRKRRSAANP